MAWLESHPYELPEWAAGLQSPPSRVQLAHRPTPIHKWNLPAELGLPDDLEVWIKRDDMTGVELSGNKVRKLEFLMAEALRGGHDSVITIGGIQSNHCRSTAAAARQLGLEVHIILRCPDDVVANPHDIGLVGNLLLDQMVGAHIHVVSLAQYIQYGQAKLVEALAEELKSNGKSPYLIPVGGSNATGSFGYIEAVDEFLKQCNEANTSFDEIWLATGSGGTLTGISAGLALAADAGALAKRPDIRAVGVCDNPQYFYDEIAAIGSDMGVKRSLSPTDLQLEVVQGKGRGYAISTDEELETATIVSRSTGIMVDPVYSGKALHHMILHYQNKKLAGPKRILFWHTGGIYGLYEKADELKRFLPSQVKLLSL